MEIPKYHETFIPILEELYKVNSISSRDLATRVRETYYSQLPKELKDKKTKSGVNILIDRIGWGKSYLKMGKFVSYPERGKVQITKKGKEILTKGVFSLEDLKNDSDFISYRQNVENKKENDKDLKIQTLEGASPQDLIDDGISSIEAKVKADLLEKTKEIKDPYYFEKVILILLNKMGYGDYIETPKSHDGGIDGVINEDELGLGKIYTQAKLYTNQKIYEKDIRNFIGAMSGDTNKGIFITTSTFAESAKQKAKDAHHSIILIDGKKLVDLMYRYNVGIQTKTVYEVKDIDNDFFEGE